LHAWLLVATVMVRPAILIFPADIFPISTKRFAAVYLGCVPYTPWSIYNWYPLVQGSDLEVRYTARRVESTTTGIYTW